MFKCKMCGKGMGLKFMSDYCDECIKEEKVGKCDYCNKYLPIGRGENFTLTTDEQWACNECKGKYGLLSEDEIEEEPYVCPHCNYKHGINEGGSELSANMKKITYTCANCNKLHTKRLDGGEQK